MGYLNELLSRNPLVIDDDTIRPHHNYTDDLYTGGNHKMTNYDRIKEMSLEEMAARFVLKDDKYKFYHCLDGFAYGTRRIAIEMNMEWLMKEVSRR